MSPAVVRLLCGAAYRSGALRVAARFSEPRHARSASSRFQILVYHRVGDADPCLPAVPAAVFERHMRYVRKHFNVLSLTALMEAVERREIPARAIAVTFDDGYEDLYRHVFPIVRRYQIPVTIFLATGFIDTGQPMWNDAIGAAIRDTHCPVLGALPGSHPLPLRTPEQRVETLNRTLSALKYRPLAERGELVGRIVRDLKVPTYAGPRMLSWRQVSDMHAAGVDFGAHTVNHPILTRLPATERWHEIAGSKRAVEERLQAPVRHFAYPNGTARDFDDVTRSLVQRAGFASAASMVFGVNTAETDRYVLRRGGPWERATAVFAAKLWWYRRQEAQ